MQEIVVTLSLIIAFLCTARLLFKFFRGQTASCGCSCQACRAAGQAADRKALLPMYQADSRDR